LQFFFDGDFWEIPRKSSFRVFRSLLWEDSSAFRGVCLLGSGRSFCAGFGTSYGSLSSYFFFIALPDVSGERNPIAPFYGGYFSFFLSRAVPPLLLIFCYDILATDDFLALCPRVEGLFLRCSILGFFDRFSCSADLGNLATCLPLPYHPN